MEKNFISLRSFCNNSVPEVNINFRNPRNFEEFILRMNSQKLFFQETQEHNHENLEIPMKFSDINIHFRYCLFLIMKKYLLFVLIRYTNTLFKYTPRVLSLKELLNKYVQNKDTVIKILQTYLPYSRSFYFMVLFVKNYQFNRL